MSGALAALGCCYLLMAAGLRCFGAPARIILAFAGLAAFGLVVFPEPAHGSTPGHLACAVGGAILLAVWPAFIGSRARPDSLVLSVRGSFTATTVFAAMLIWVLAEARGGSQLGLAERASTAIETSWPFVVAMAARRATTRSPRRTRALGMNRPAECAFED